MKTIYIKYQQKINLLTSLLLLISCISNAQQTTTNENAPEGNYREKVTVVSSFDPTLSDANKIVTFPSIFDTTEFKPNLSYGINSKRISTSIALENIKAAKFVGEPIDKLYHSYLKLGMGTYTTPYMELFCNSIRSKKHALGVHVKSLNTFGQIKDYAELSSQGENQINLFGKKFYDNFTLAGNLSYNYNFANYYGFKPSENTNLQYNKKDLRQHFNIINFGVSAYNNQIKERVLIHKTNIDGYYWADKYKACETNIGLNGDVNTLQQLFKTDNSKQTLGILYDFDFYHNSSDTISHNSALLKIQPYIKMNFDKLKVTAGFDFATIFDSVSPKFLIHPILDLQMNIWGNYLILYGGIKGETYKNTYNSLTTENPFLKSGTELQYSNNRFSLYAGFASSVWQDLDVKIYGQYLMFDNLPLFINDTSAFKNTTYYLNNEFKTIYDDANIVKLGGELIYDNKTDFSIRLSANYYLYNMANEEKAWHKPAFESTLATRYSLAKKIILKLDLSYYSKMKSLIYNRDLATPNFEIIDVNTKGIFDLSIGCEYQYNKLLSAFINLNNLTASRYMLLQNYPAHRFNAMLGISLNF